MKFLNITKSLCLILIITSLQTGQVNASKDRGVIQIAHITHDQIMPLSTWVNSQTNKNYLENNIKANNNVDKYRHANKTIINANRPDIVSRSEWGADESLGFTTARYFQNILNSLGVNSTKKRKTKLPFLGEISINRTVEYIDNLKLVWPQAYPKKISKIIVHHTASKTKNVNTYEAMRNIYRYHTVSRGYGDIGYNYVIINGKILEGRAGGKGVVAGHAYDTNAGTVGVAIYGNFDNDHISTKDYKSLISILTYLSLIHNIDPKGETEYRGVKFENIAAHRDVGYTTCPGKNLYSLIPDIVNVVSKKVGNIKNKTLPFTAEVINEKALIYRSPEDVIIRIKNKSNKQIPKGTYLKIKNKRKLLRDIKVLTPERVKTTKALYKNQYFDFKLNMQAIKNIDTTKNMEFMLYHKNKPLFPESFNQNLEISKQKLTYNIIKNISLSEYLNKGTKYIRTVKIKNTGNIEWHKSGKNKIRLINSKINNSVFGNKRIISEPLEEIIRPGQIATFKISFIVPRNSKGEYQESINPILNNKKIINGLGINFNFNVLQPFAGKLVSKSFVTKPIQNNGFGVYNLKIKNIGQRTWTKRTFKISYDKKVTTVKDVNISIKPKEVKHGEIMDINVNFKNPEKGNIVKFIPKLTVLNKSLFKEPLGFTYGMNKNKVKQISQEKITSFNNKNRNIDLENNIKIHISNANNKIQKISNNKGWTLYNNLKEINSFPAHSEVEFRLINNKQISITNSGKQEAITIDNKCLNLMSDSNNIFTINNLERRPGWNKSLNDNQFRDNIDLCLDNNKLLIVNNLDLFNYMKGLAETTANSPIEKRKAIVTLARSYAKYYMTRSRKFPGKPYDLNDDPNMSQKYIGYGFEKRAPWHVEDVKTTRDKVVYYKNKVIKTPYFHSDDGRTRSAQEVWGWKDTPYLNSKNDPHCKGLRLLGHGVGMSGCGAEGFAKDGKNMYWLIDYYFPGTIVK